MRPAVLLALVAVACGDTVRLARSSEVVDLRVLAVRADPPEVMVENVLAQSPYAPVDEVRFEMLAVDPRGHPMTVTWGNCPIESGDGCFDYDERLTAKLNGIESAFDQFIGPDSGLTGADVSEVIRRGVNRIRAATEGPHVIDAPFAPDSPVEAYPVPPFSLPLLDAGMPTFETCTLLGYHALASQFGLLQGAWPSVTASLHAADRSLELQKRFILNVGEPGRVEQLLPDLLGCLTGGSAGGMQIDPFSLDPEDFLGFLPCPAPPAERPERCLDFSPRQPNRNPQFAQILVAAGESADAEFHPLEVTPVQLLVERSLRILPVFTDDSAEKYEEIKTDLESARLFIDEVTEELSVSWFVTAGRVENNLTWRITTRTLDTTFTAPDEVPLNTGGIVTVWMVASDQRGGTSWTSLPVQICGEGGDC